MHQTIKEPIKVLVSFFGQQVRPLAFFWKGRRYEIDKINLVHSLRQGRDTLYYFSVSDKANFYRLSFDTGSLAWSLEEIYAEG
ncbi:MAG: hypothetical protein WC528_04530 [Patescibacteria group bacterium]